MPQTILTTQTFLASYNEGLESIKKLLGQAAASQEVLDNFLKQVTLDGLISILEAREAKSTITLERLFELSSKMIEKKDLNEEEIALFAREEELSAPIFCLFEAFNLTGLIQSHEDMKRASAACPRMATSWIQTDSERLLNFITTWKQWDEWPLFMQLSFATFSPSLITRLFCNNLQTFRNTHADWLLERIFTNHADELWGLFKTGRDFLDWAFEQPVQATKFLLLSEAYDKIAGLLTADEFIRLAKKDDTLQTMASCIMTKAPKTIASKIKDPKQLKELPGAMLLVTTSSDKLIDICNTVEGLLIQDSCFLGRHWQFLQKNLWVCLKRLMISLSFPSNINLLLNVHLMRNPLKSLLYSRAPMNWFPLT